MKQFFLTRIETIRDLVSSQSLPTLDDLRRLFGWGFWSEPRIAPQSAFILPAIGLLILVVIVLWSWRLRLKRADKNLPVYAWPINQLANLIVFILVVSFSYWFFRYQGIAYLSSRLVILGALIFFLLWLGLIVGYFFRVIPTKRQLYLEKERFFRYLPKSKKNG